jgi:hypothetical protein
MVLAERWVNTEGKYRQTMMSSFGLCSKLPIHSNLLQNILAEAEKNKQTTNKPPYTNTGV